MYKFFFVVSHFHEFNFIYIKMLAIWMSYWAIYVGRYIYNTKIIYIIKCIVMRSVEIKCSKKNRITMPLIYFIFFLIGDYRLTCEKGTKWCFVSFWVDDTSCYLGNFIFFAKFGPLSFVKLFYCTNKKRWFMNLRELWNWTHFCCHVQEHSH